MKNETLNIRSGTSSAELKQAILDHLCFLQGKSTSLATQHDWYMAVAYTVRDRMMVKWVDSLQRLNEKDLKIVGYLSAEFLMGPHLGNALINLGIVDEVREAAMSLGLNP
jgi:starch phosphorylase